jgi:oligopeptidase B
MNVSTRNEYSSLQTSPSKERSPNPLKQKKWIIVLIFFALLFLNVLLLIIGNSKASSKCKIPRAKEIEMSRTLDNKVDNFLWMKNNGNDFNQWVEEENSYTLNMVDNALIETLGAEIDSNSPTKGNIDKFWIQERYLYAVDHSKDYPVYKRSVMDKNDSITDILRHPDKLKIILDVNKITSDFKNIGSTSVSPNENFLSYTIDLKGKEVYSLYIVDLVSGNQLESIEINDVSADVSWASDDCVVYSKVDSLVISRTVWSFCMASKKEQFLYKEDDDSLELKVSVSGDKQYVIIGSIGQITGNSRLLRTSLINTDLSNFKFNPCFIPEIGINYDVQHSYNGMFYIRTNFNAENFRIIRMPLTDMSSKWENFKEIVPTNSDIIIDKFQVFQTFILCWIFRNGIREIHVRDLDGQLLDIIKGETSSPVYSLYPGTSQYVIDPVSFSKSTFIYSVESYLTTKSVISYDVNTRTKSVILDSVGKYTHEFEEKRFLVPSYDGTLIPMVVVGKVNLGISPLLAVAYGAYGTYVESFFETKYLSLLKRNCKIAFIEPRGTGSMGWKHYTQGKYEYKINTFLDIRRALLYLIDEKFTDFGRIALFGRSAGGLVTGTSLNWWSIFSGKRNQKLKGVYDEKTKKEFMDAIDTNNIRNNIVRTFVMQVPFVDPVFDMSDKTMAWVDYEFYEWGNPRNSSKIYEAMVDYSPYDNIMVKNQPATLVTSGKQDSRVIF